MLSAPFEMHTDAIDSRGEFDPRYTCESDNSSPELRWSGAPAGTRSFAVVAEDSTSLFAHWIVYDIPAAITHLPAGIPAQETLPNGIRQGLNGHRKLGYGGPCPPAGEAPHSYIIRVYALSVEPGAPALRLPARATREALLAAIEPLVLGWTAVGGRFHRGRGDGNLKRAG